MKSILMIAVMAFLSVSFAKSPKVENLMALEAAVLNVAAVGSNGAQLTFNMNENAVPSIKQGTLTWKVEVSTPNGITRKYDVVQLVGNLQSEDAQAFIYGEILSVTRAQREIPNHLKSQIQNYITPASNYSQDTLEGSDGSHINQGTKSERTWMHDRDNMDYQPSSTDSDTLRH